MPAGAGAAGPSPVLAQNEQQFKDEGLTQMRRISVPVALLFIFTVSGFSGLIYESIWSHYLKLFLGHAAYSQTLVLALFMGGMAIGSWLCSRWSGGWRN